MPRWLLNVRGSQSRKHRWPTRTALAPLQSDNCRLDFAKQKNSGPKSGPEFFYARNEALVASRQGSAEVPSYGRKLIASPCHYKCRLRSERLSRLEQTSSGKMMRVIADGAPLQTSAGNSIRELISSSSRSMASIVASSRSSAAS